MENVFDDGGIFLDPGEIGRERDGLLIVCAEGRGPDQHGLPCEGSRREPPVNHVGRRNVRKAPLWANVIDQHPRFLVSWDNDLAKAYPYSQNQRHPVAWHAEIAPRDLQTRRRVVLLLGAIPDSQILVPGDVVEIGDAEYVYQAHRCIGELLARRHRVCGLMRLWGFTAARPPTRR